LLVGNFERNLKKVPNLVLVGVIQIVTFLMFFLLLQP